MSTFNKITIAAALAITSMAFAQTPAEHAAHHPGAATATSNRMAMMNTHMKAMCDIHAKFKRARTPAQREALMAEHMKLMREGMAMHDGSQGMHGMQGMHSGDAAPGGMAAGMAAHRDMMEKRMETMQSMMQTILDRLPPAPGRP